MDELNLAARFSSARLREQIYHLRISIPLAPPMAIPLRLSHVTADSVLCLVNGWQWEIKFGNLRERFSAMLSPQATPKAHFPGAFYRVNVCGNHRQELFHCDRDGFAISNS